MRNKSVELKLNTQKHSVYSLVSFVLAISGLGFFIWAVIISAFHNEGTTGGHTYVGLLEITSMVATLTGFIFGIIGEFMENDNRIFSHIALPIHLILIFSHLLVLLTGF